MALDMMTKHGKEEYPLRRRVLAILAAASGLGAVFLALVLLLGSCSSRLAGELRRDGSARLEFRAELPAPIADKLRRLGSGGRPVDPSIPLLDAAALRASLASRPYLELVELSQPSPDSIRGTLLVRSLAQAAASPDFASPQAGQAGALSYRKGPDWAELSLRLDRGRAGALRSLLAGLDPGLLEALSPPALEGEEALSAEEYRTLLKSLLGEKAMPALDAAAIDLSIAAPGQVLDSRGGSLAGSTLTARIPLLDLLVLEEPVELGLRWKQ